jgi:hypothetical protein
MAYHIKINTSVTAQIYRVKITETRTEKIIFKQVLGL